MRGGRVGPDHLHGASLHLFVEVTFVLVLVVILIAVINSTGLS